MIVRVIEAPQIIAVVMLTRGLFAVLAGIGPDMLNLHDVIRRGNVRKQRSNNQGGADNLQNAGTEGAQAAFASIGKRHRSERDCAQQCPNRIQNEIELHAFLRLTRSELKDFLATKLRLKSSVCIGFVKMRATALKVSRLLTVLVFVSCAFGTDTVSLPSVISQAPQPPAYYWTEAPVAEGAELVTLFGRFGTDSAGAAVPDVPLVSVLRDSLDNSEPNDDRLRYVWLLTSNRPTFAQRVLSAVPFFYWKLGKGGSPSGGTPAMLADLSHPAHRVWRTAERDILQWTALDPMTMPVRASSHAYRTNNANEERVHLEEAIALLRRAPASTDGSGLTGDQIDGVVARLMLAKNIMGGLMKDGQLERVGNGRDAQRQSTIGRNWELLRTSAERTGLIFEPLQLGGTGENYAILWFPLGTTFAPPGISLASTWKLLHISNPWRDTRLKTWEGYVQGRSLDKDGKLLPVGETGAKEIDLAPLAVYSLTYPRSPLLMIDFRNKTQTKRREVIQRATDEIVSGVLGLSHFGNWYYYAGNGLYQFVKSRRGAAVNAGARIDSYAEFRVAAALDTSLDPAFRKQLRQRTDGLSANPLNVSVRQQLSAASRNYRALLAEAADPEKLPKQLDNDRRHELASFGKSTPSEIGATALHYLTLTAYTRRAPRREGNLALLSRERKTKAALQYLTQVANAGPQPEVTFNLDRIHQSIAELENLVDANSPKQIRNQAATALEGVRAQSLDTGLRADCSRALVAFNGLNPIQTPPLSSGHTVASTILLDAAPTLKTK